MTAILALDTATERCSAALWRDGELHVRSERSPQQHLALALPFVDTLLREAGLALGDLDALAMGCGPGSFTGLRIAAGIIQGLAMGAGLPVYRVSDLAALARQAWRVHGWPEVVACLDARMGEVYWGAYRLQGEALEAVVTDRLTAPAEVAVSAGGRWRVAGPGWTTFQPVVGASLGTREGDGTLLPEAADIAVLAAAARRRGDPGVAAERALPVYLRERVADERAVGR